MAEEVKSLLDAVSGAIDGADSMPVPAKEEPATDEDADADGAADDGAAADVEADAGAAPEDGTDVDPKGKVPDTEAPKGAAGAGKPKDGQAPAGEAETAAEKAAKEAAAKPVDPVNDPLDPRWKENTRTRVQSLIDTVKQRDAALEQANTLFDAVADTGMGPDELATMLSYARTRHHGTPEQKKQALAFLKEELRGLATELGDVDAADFLADHADLQAAVEANQITADYAKEVALSRARAKQQTVTTEASIAQRATQQAHTNGVASMNTLGAQLAKRDGAVVFAAKQATLKATLGPRRDAAGNITHRGILANFPPEQWAQVYQNAYEALPAPIAAPTLPDPALPPTGGGPKPLRPSTPAGGGGKREAKSLLDAVSSAVDGIDD